VVASTLMALGMMMLSPVDHIDAVQAVALVLVDGWALTMGSLAASFGPGLAGWLTPIISSGWRSRRYGSWPSPTAPILIPALAAGLILGMIQAATSIQEQTLSFVPKLIVVAACLALFGGAI
jgi:hypothetical protein